VSFILPETAGAAASIPSMSNDVRLPEVTPIDDAKARQPDGRRPACQLTGDSLRPCRDLELSAVEPRAEPFSNRRRNNKP
jgi:hypothetical protein